MFPSPEIVQTIGCLRKAPKTDWSGPIKWKNRNRLELPALVTARGHTENGSVMAPRPHEAACASELSANTSFL